MGWLASRIRLKWREPKSVRRYFDRLKAKKSYLHKGMAFIFTVGLGMLIWWRAVLNPEKNPPPFRTALELSMCLAIMVVYLPALVYRYARSTIMIHNDRIRRIRGNICRDCKYTNIETYSIDSKTIDGHVFPVLSVIPKKGKAFVIGIDSSISLEELEKILSERMSQARSGKKQHSFKDMNPNL